MQSSKADELHLAKNCLKETSSPEFLTPEVPPGSPAGSCKNRPPRNAAKHKATTKISEYPVLLFGTSDALLGSIFNGLAWQFNGSSMGWHGRHDTSLFRFHVS